MIEIKELKRNFKSMYLLILAIFIVVTLSFMIQASNEIVTNINKEHYHSVGTITFDSIGNDYDKLDKVLRSKNVENAKLKLETPEEIDVNIDTVGGVSIYDYFLVNMDSQNLNVKEIEVPTIYALYHNFKVGDEIIIRNNELNIVGLSDDSSDNAFLISTDTAKLLNLNTDSIELDLSDELTDIEKNSFVENLSEELNAKADSNGLYKNTFDRTNGKIIIVILISVFSMMVIYYYILSERKEKYYIFKFSGMTKNKFYRILIVELLVTYIFSFLLSLIIFSVINTLLLKNVFGILRYDLTLSSIIHVFLVFIVILILFMSVNIYFYFKKSLVEGFKEGM